MSKRTFDTFLFDLDGTLIDSIELILSSYRHTLQAHRGTVPSDEVWLAGLGTPLRTQFRLFTADPEEIEAMVATYREHNFMHHDALVREYPGVRAMVQQLQADGVRLAVVTSKNRGGSLRGLKHCKLDDAFDVIVSADDVERHKPDPAPVEKALDLLGAEPHTTVFIGDSPHDVVAGRGAGVATAAVLWGPFPREALAAENPDYWLEQPSQVLALTGQK